MTSYLIVATYNHEAYKGLEAAETESESGRDQARAVARNLFGRRPVDEGGNYTGDESEAADKPLTEYFTYAGAFPYMPIADGDPDKEHKRANYLYGWVAIVPDEEKLNALKEFIAWPDGPFCQVFDIQVSEIKPLEASVQTGNLGLKDRDQKAWRERGFDIYEYQTPAMWR